MTPETLIVVIILLFGGYVWYAINNLKNKCLCTYRRRSKQRLEKYIPLRAEGVVFEGKRFEIVPDRAGLQWKTILGLFGTWVITYDFSWYYRYPHNPNDFANVWDSPELRHNINLEERMRAFAKGYPSMATGKKASVLQQYLPWIAILAVVIIGVMVYNQSQHINLLEQMMKIPKP